jgi:hypothetical protein
MHKKILPHFSIRRTKKLIADEVWFRPRFRAATDKASFPSSVIWLFSVPWHHVRSKHIDHSSSPRMYSLLFSEMILVNAGRESCKSSTPGVDAQLRRRKECCHQLSSEGELVQEVLLRWYVPRHPMYHTLTSSVSSATKISNVSILNHLPTWLTSSTLVSSTQVGGFAFARLRLTISHG